MSEAEQNPYAAVPIESEPTIEISVPLSVYGYAFVVFLLGAFAGSFVLFLPIAATGLSPGLVMLLSALLSLPCGLYTARGMYRKLADIHRRKVAWQIEQAERLGEFY